MKPSAPSLRVMPWCIRWMLAKTVALVTAPTSDPNHARARP
jgi:hypothetical protein